MEVCGWGEVPSSLSAGLDSGRGVRTPPATATQRSLTPPPGALARNHKPAS